MEKWKDIPGYEGLYQASNFGRIRTHPNKTTFTERHGVRRWKSRIMKGRGKADSGYRVELWKNGVSTDYLVARLVAFTWVDGYQPGFTVNHKNGNRYDNNIENLEWLSLADNIRHGFNTGLYPSKEITLKEVKTGRLFNFNSLASASRFLGHSSGYVSTQLKRGGSIERNKYILGNADEI